LKKSSILLIVLFSSSASIFGQQIEAEDYYHIPRLSSEITFDGMPYEEAWQNLDPFEIHQFEPIYEGEVTDRTELFMTYDENYLYCAGRMFAEPSDIMDTGKGRDLFKPNMDSFGVILDTFNDSENGLVFQTSPSGLRLDMTIANDAEGQGFPMNPTWNTFWDAKTVKTDSAWFAEIRIPWSSLRFQDTDGEVTMGLIIRRWMPSKSQVLMYPKVRNDLGGWSHWKPSQGQRVVFKGIKSKKPVYIAPYVLGGVQSDTDLNDSGTEYITNVEPEFSAGLDIKYGITSNLTMDITINPDFAQVEADDQQVNLNRFDLFFPEKRLFFQERASTFNFSMGGPNTIFYSRRIGLYDEEIIPIYGGVRLNGRVGKWDFGFLDMQTVKTDSLPSTNYGVIRLRKQVINTQSYVGGMIANQIDVNGRFNTALGIDGIFRVLGNDFVSINYAQTYENNGIKTPFSMEHAKIRALWEKRSNRGLGYSFGYNRAGASYNPEMGFENREDATRLGNSIWWGWLYTSGTWIQSQKVSINGQLYKKNKDWSTESGDIGLGWEFSSRNNWRGEIKYAHAVEGVAEEFEVGDVDIPVGRYEFDVVAIDGSTPFSLPIRLQFGGYIGTYFDGEGYALNFAPTWTISPSVELEGRYEYTHADFDSRNQKLRLHLGGVKTRFMFSNALSAILFVQWNSDTDEVVSNFRIRYNPREGNDLYIVYNDNMNIDRQREIPTLPLYSVQSLVLKYTYTFTSAR
jgi:hypothetical protein